MKNWWLKLYTIPYLLSGAKVAGLISLLIIALHFIFGIQESGLYCFVYLGYHLFKKREDTLMDNVEFHKISVPLRELKKIFYLETTISTLGSLSIIAMGIILTSVVNDYTLRGILDVLGFFIATPSYTILIVIFSIMTVVWSKYAHNCRTANKEMLKRAQEQYKVKKALNKNSLFKRALIFCGLLLATAVGAIIGIFIVSKIDASPFLFFIWMMGFVGISSLHNFYRLSFNLERSLFKTKRSSKPLLISLGAYSTIILLCALMFRFEVNSAKYSASSRAKGIELFQLFSPELESNTVADLLEVSPDSADVIWKKAHKGIWQEPFTQIYNGKNLYVWDQYLKHGKPAEANLFYMLNELETHPERKDWLSYYDYRGVRLKIVYYLPEAKRLPQELQKGDGRLPATVGRPKLKKKTGP